MESYLMMLYVTLEQESALKNFFVDQGWTFCKPDLSVTTDKLGPVVPNPPILSEETDFPDTEIDLPDTDDASERKQTFPTIKISIPPSKPTSKTASPKQKGKRKTKSQKQTATKAKQAKIMTSTSVPEATKSNEILEAGTVDGANSETQDTSAIKTPITVQSEDGNQFTIKIEQESHDSDKDEDEGEVDKTDVIGEDDSDEDGDDDNDEATDIDYSYEGASTSEGNTSVKTESQSLGDNSVKVDNAAAGGSTGKHKRKRARRYRSAYETSDLIHAYNLVKEGGVSINKAARMCNVPKSTLLDRVSNRVSLNVTRQGPEPILSVEEEDKLTAHLIELANVGYGYTQSEITHHASDFAIVLGKRAADNPISKRWYKGYTSRHPESERVKPVLQHNQKSFCASKKTISKYYEKLNGIIREYNLDSKPENIYLMDEIDIDLDTNAEEQCSTLTVIGAGSAAGQSIPPYFVMVTLLKNDDNKVMRKSQLITNTFKNYLSSHFMTYANRINNENEPLIVLYDGHKSHLSVDLVEWGKINHVVLFVIPPHESCIVKARIGSVFDCVKSKCTTECNKPANDDEQIEANADAISVARKVYADVVKAAALQSWFKSSGIYPLQDGKSMCELLERQNKLS